ncbi:MAG: AraC family transcriptional regulator [Dorea sp.]|nr:AraC family transcriptional regulator [Dorea sp.]
MALWICQSIDVGAAVGYPNLPAFSRTFKGVYGMSPREYRQRNMTVDKGYQ